MLERFTYQICKYIFLIAFFLPMIAHSKNEIPISKEGLKQRTGFIENKGQIIDQNNKSNPAVKYLLNTPGLNVLLRRNGFSYDVYNVRTFTDSSEARSGFRPLQGIEPTCDSVYVQRIDIDLSGADPNCRIIVTAPSADYNNYYTTGTSPEGITRVRSYDSVTYRDIYPGIDLQFHMTESGGFKSNFILHPGARLSDIKYSISGSEVQVSDDGSLIFHTTQGDVEEKIPECRYITNQGSRTFETGFIRLEENIFGFSTAEAIPQNATVIIDPSCKRLWGTYYGGVGQELSATALDSRSGMVLFGGTTMNSDYIATAGAFQSTFGGTRDAFFARFTSSCQRIWATYYGGPQDDYLYGLFIDAHNRVVVSGWTINDDIFGTPGACQEHFAGGDGDCWVARFTPEGTRLWGTYYGGLEYEHSGLCTADASCNVYLAGSTASPNNISTPDAWQFNNAGTEDSFLVKFDSNGVRRWGTYFGGLLGEYTERVSCDTAGNTYICGFTNSGNNIATPGVFQTIPGGTTDAFVEKFSTDGQRIWGTYYGGSGADFATSLKPGDDGSVYLCGHTTSTSGIASPGAFQTLPGGLQDGYVAKLTPSGQRSWGTYYGEIGQDYLYDVSLSDNGYLFLAGITTSTNSMATPDSYQPNLAGGIWDGFFLKFDTTGLREWGSYYGDYGYDLLNAIKYVAQDTIYLYGETNSVSGIATPGSFQPNVWPNPQHDEFLVQLIDCWTLNPPTVINGPVSVCQMTSGVLYSTSPIPHAQSYEWTVPPGTMITGVGSGDTISVNFTPIAQSGQVTVKGINKCHDAGPLLSLPVTVHPRPLSFTLTGNDTPCQNVPENYYTDPGMSNYIWTQTGTIVSGGTATDSTITILWSNAGAQTVSVNYINPAGCAAIDPTVLNVNVQTSSPVSISITGSATSVCEGTMVTFTATPVNPGVNPAYQWQVNAVNAINANNAVFSYTPLDGDVVTCSLLSSETCSSGNPALSNPVTMVVNPNLPVSVSIVAS
ncbi:MAG: hypothetical protein Q8M08_12100, partial [Bacteroidales bacterium]|nr:hypothetical protein [Bacteroidales bacterium]